MTSFADDCNPFGSIEVGGDTTRLEPQAHSMNEQLLRAALCDEAPQVHALLREEQGLWSGSAFATLADPQQNPILMAAFGLTPEHPVSRRVLSVFDHWLGDIRERTFEGWSLLQLAVLHRRPHAVRWALVDAQGVFLPKLLFRAALLPPSRHTAPSTSVASESSIRLANTQQSHRPSLSTPQPPAWTLHPGLSALGLAGEMGDVQWLETVLTLSREPSACSSSPLSHAAYRDAIQPQPLLAQLLLAQQHQLVASTQPSQPSMMLSDSASAPESTSAGPTPASPMPSALDPVPTQPVPSPAPADERRQAITNKESIAFADPVAQPARDWGACIQWLGERGFSPDSRHGETEFCARLLACDAHSRSKALIEQAWALGEASRPTLLYRRFHQSPLRKDTSFCRAQIGPFEVAGALFDFRWRRNLVLCGLKEGPEHGVWAVGAARRLVVEFLEGVNPLHRSLHPHAPLEDVLFEFHHARNTHPELLTTLPLGGLEFELLEFLAAHPQDARFSFDAQHDAPLLAWKERVLLAQSLHVSSTPNALNGGQPSTQLLATPVNSEQRPETPEVSKSPVVSPPDPSLNAPKGFSSTPRRL